MKIAIVTGASSGLGMAFVRRLDALGGLDEIWGVDSDTGWETVTVHIGRLRKRFAGWEEFEIISVRGLGYKAVKKV